MNEVIVKRNEYTCSEGRIATKSDDLVPTWWKGRTDSQSCLLTFTSVLWDVCGCTRGHTQLFCFVF